MATIEDAVLPLDSLKPHPLNYNLHKKPGLVERMAARIDGCVFTAPVIVNPSGTVLGGHLRRLALLHLRELGSLEPPGIGEGWLVPVRIFRGTEAQEKAVLVGDNPDPDDLEYDLTLLTGLLSDIHGEGELENTGYEEERLDQLLSVMREHAPEPPPPPPTLTATKPLVAENVDPDAIPEEVPTRVKVGQIWALGRHRLICGDCTDQDVVNKLMDGAKVDIILTDPPYCSGGFQEAGRSAGSTTACKSKPKVERDNLTTEGLEGLLERGIGRMPSKGCCFVFCDWRQIFTVRRVVEPLGFQYRAMLVWDKGTPGMGGPFRHQHELVYFGTKRKEASWGKHGDVIQACRTGNEHHTTEKPVELLTKLLEDIPGDLVGDPFSGSGSTLIACEQTGRTCYSVELTPGYCDTILARFEALTGQTAQLIG